MLKVANFCPHDIVYFITSESSLVLLPYGNIFLFQSIYLLGSCPIRHVHQDPERCFGTKLSRIQCI